jgi:AraC-like DNA-binding protein
MRDLLHALAPLEGSQTCAIEGVTLLRITKSLPRMPVLYEPCVVFVLQGKKTGYLGEQCFRYNAGSFLLLPMPLPFECETHVEDGAPLLSLYVRLRPEIIAELLTALQHQHPATSSGPKAVQAKPLCGSLADAVLRLLKALSDPNEAKILGLQLIREIHFRLLQSRDGDSVWAAMGFDGHFAKISRALQTIHRDYSRTLQVSHLANEVGMSESVFHLHFKQVTSASPIQYIKAVRLHRARTLLLDERLGANEVARRVGYASPSQFGREYKRMFGHSPLNDLAKIRSEPML